MHFPNLTCLSLQASEDLLIDELNLTGFNWDTDFAILGNFESLIQVDLTDAKQIKNEHFASLSSFPNLTQLDISGCTQITDFKFLESLQKLESLIADGLQIPQEQLRNLEGRGVIVVTQMS
jgi:Leucine-rich repeat (LRR) protein